MQAKNMQLDTTVTLFEQTARFFQEYRKDGFGNAFVMAKDLAEELEMSADEVIITNENSVCRKRLRKQFSYEADDESIVDSPTQQNIFAFPFS